LSRANPIESIDISMESPTLRDTGGFLSQKDGFMGFLAP
jgi:hypothetical protein